MPFIPLTDANRREMLEAIGVSDFEELLSGIPAKARCRGEWKLPEPLSELEVTRLMEDLASENEHTGTHICFLGGGAYDHFIPAAVDAIISRSEFYTAYTPYQPEVAQGNLQAIYEYQTLIANLTAMDVANASMYDGATSLAEAALLAYSHTKRNRILVSKSVHPFYRRVIGTYCHRSGLEVQEIGMDNGALSLKSLKESLSDQTAAVIVQHPNFFGNLEDVEAVEKIAHDAGALYVVSVDPISLGMLKPPGAYGADVATGEGQVFGNALNYGGPYVGIFTVKQDLIRKLPGRLVGVTQDTEGRRGFVLTLQTREQHIRREKATSSICTNEQLCALASTVYLSLMGKHGLPKVADLCFQKAHYLADRLTEIPDVQLAFDRPFFKEFTLQLPVKAEKVIQALRKEHIFAGIDLGRFDPRMEKHLLVAVTEKRTRKEMDLFAERLASAVS